MKYKVGICDDEKGTCAEIEEYIYDYFKDKKNSVDVLVWYDSESCIKGIENDKAINILFLDIELPDKNGVDLGEIIRKKLNLNSMHIVYISSKTNYAMELFKVHPYDFLIKPIGRDMVYDVLEKILLIDITDQRFFSYSFNKILFKVAVGSIVFLESIGRKIYIHLNDSQVREYNGKLKDALLKLPGQFVMVNQSYIINLKYVVECGYEYAIMLNHETISITSKYRENFRNSLQSYNRGGSE